MRILIVDDMPVNGMMVAELFRGLQKENGETDDAVQIFEENVGKDAGNRICADTCTDGQQALVFVQEKEYDLILLDRHMPGMDGPEVFARLREYWRKSGKKPVPVAAMTGEDHAGAREEYLQRGFLGYIKKPVDPAELFSFCREVVPGFTFEWENASEGSLSRGSTAVSETPVKNELLKRIGASGVIDLSEGLLHSGTEANLLQSLHIFSDSVRRRLTEIEEDLKREDVGSLKDHTHALKGVSGMVGAVDLFRLAEETESACREAEPKPESDRKAEAACREAEPRRQDWAEKAMQSGRRLKELYRESGDTLWGIFAQTPEENAGAKNSGAGEEGGRGGRTRLSKEGGRGGRTRLSEEEWADARRTIRECLEFYDYNSIGLIMDSLEDYTLTKEQLEWKESVREAAAELDRRRLTELT